MNLQRLFDISSERTSAEQDLYNAIVWPDPPADRPYVYINMASTADGKVVVGKPGGTAKGVGGPTDQILFRRLQRQCDAAFVGSSTLRAGPVIYPDHLPRLTVTHSGELPLTNRFFTDAPGRAYVFAPRTLKHDVATRISAAANLIQQDGDEVDLTIAMGWMRRELNIRTLLCEGGPTINDQLVRAGLADELFLTLAPKLKGGSNIPTIMTGTGFPPGISRSLNLLSLYKDGDELYLRYRIGQE